jgi:glycine cleavage system pyridoxal-binding protein P
MTKIILEGITLDDFKSLLQESFRAEISANESKKVAPMTKTEACRRIGITNKTLQKILGEMNMKDVYPSDINRILLKYPKFIKKAAKVEH